MLLESKNAELLNRKASPFCVSFARVIDPVDLRLLEKFPELLVQVATLAASCPSGFSTTTRVASPR